MTYGGKCGRCGGPLKLLFTSWYCDCAEREDNFVAFGIMTSLDTEEYKIDGFIPRGGFVYLFKERREADSIVEAFMGFSLLRVWIPRGEFVIWCSVEQLQAHEVCSQLPFEVLQ